MDTVGAEGCQLLLVYKMPFRRVRTWPRPSVRASKGILHTTKVLEKLRVLL